MQLAAAVCVASAVITATDCGWAATVVAENKQEQNDEPQNCVITVEKTATAVRATAVITKQIHK